ncbi:MAG: anhydro-N-acetylmuramic acid kinase [Cyclobacteriaceae bacterium]|nr:anhydro-N-acetylmuramic acid kinase [Cyclobacteriaceae bacterium]
MTEEKYSVIGLMSGTSLDGLDMAHCTFKHDGSSWSYQLKRAVTIPYTAAWRKHLITAHLYAGEELIALDIAYGKFLGDACLKFIKANRLKADFISSHGHTIFHQPKKGFTFQLGNGQALYATSGVPVILDFRSLDVLRGGEGAPLVPAGDKFLFNEYSVCLNLGGIANLSMDVKGRRLAYDICFLNMGLNYLATKAGKKFDAQGLMADSGALHTGLWKNLMRVYAGLRKKRPSLGREIFEKQVQPLLDDESIPLNDRLRTFTDSAAAEISSSILTTSEKPRVLCTGGGAFNSFFISRLLEFCGDYAELIIPEDDVVNFKEALVFAFLGVLRYRGEINCLKSVTHASRDSSSGVMIGF